jgi:hypothetical protein
MVSRKRFARVRAPGLAAVAVACALAAPALGSGGAVPTRLLGTFGRTIPAKDLAQTGLPQAYGRWSLTIKKDRTLFLQGPQAFSTYEHLTATSSTRFTVRDDFCTPRAGTYGWKLSGKSLKVVNVKDRCSDRSAVLAGVWKRK